MSILRSKWGSLSEVLQAVIFPVDSTGKFIAGSPQVIAPLFEASLEVSANWQSPFEQSGPESKIPAVMAMLQTGTLQSYAETILGKGDPGDNSLSARVSRDITEFSRDGQGRSGMTKLNSTQVFTGAAPIKVPLTLRFRAFDDPDAEVQQPIDQLIRWSLARSLAKDGNIVAAIQSFRDGQGFLKALLPSQAPQMVGMTYGGYTFAPMVIESIQHPITVPRTREGDPLHVAVQLTLASLTALDAGDWTRARNGQPTLLFNTST